MKCEECQWYEEKTTHCRYNPPVVISNESIGRMTCFPEVDKEHFCSKYLLKSKDVKSTLAEIANAFKKK